MSRTRRINAANKRRHERIHRKFGPLLMRTGEPLRLLVPPLEMVAFRFTMTRPMFYDRQNQPLEWDEFAVLHSFRSYCRVDEATIGPLWISTVWLGHDMGYGAGLGDRLAAGEWTPIVFETMVFRTPGEEDIHPELEAYVEAIVRYESEEEALAGHAAVCVDIRQTMAKIDMAREVMDEALSRKV